MLGFNIICLKRDTFLFYFIFAAVHMFEEINSVRIDLFI